MTEEGWEKLLLSELTESVVLGTEVAKQLNSLRHSGITGEGRNPSSASTEEDSPKNAFCNATVVRSKSFLDFTKCSPAVCTEGKSAKGKYFGFQIKQLVYEVLSRVSSFRYNSSFN